MEWTVYDVIRSVSTF